MCLRFSLILSATPLDALKYIITARATITGESNGKMNSIGTARMPISMDFTILLAMCISGERFTPAERRSISSCIRLNSLMRSRLEIHIARSPSQISSVLVFFSCRLARLLIALEVLKNGTRKQSTRMRKSPTPKIEPISACNIDYLLTSCIRWAWCISS